MLLSYAQICTISSFVYVFDFKSIIFHLWRINDCPLYTAVCTALHSAFILVFIHILDLLNKFKWKMWIIIINVIVTLSHWFIILLLFFIIFRLELLFHCLRF